MCIGLYSDGLQRSIAIQKSHVEQPSGRFVSFAAGSASVQYLPVVPHCQVSFFPCQVQHLRMRVASLKAQSAVQELLLQQNACGTSQCRCPKVLKTSLYKSSTRDCMCERQYKRQRKGRRVEDCMQAHYLIRRCHRHDIALQELTSLWPLHACTRKTRFLSILASL